MKYKNCPDDCSGCSCHLHPPCSHCTDHNEDETKCEERIVTTPQPIECCISNVQKRYIDKIKNDVCELEIEKQDSGYACANYIVELLSGDWSGLDLITICDNKNFDGAERHFGGRVTSIGANKKRVTVFID